MKLESKFGMILQESEWFNKIKMARKPDKVKKQNLAGWTGKGKYEKEIWGKGEEKVWSWISRWGELFERIFIYLHVKDK